MPKDQWAFLPGDDELEEPLDELPAEESAVHLDAGGTATPASDPGRSEVLLGADTVPPPVSFFPDEEPEESRLGRPDEVAEDDRAEDLEEILEEQHYAFGAESSEE